MNSSLKKLSLLAIGAFLVSFFISCNATKRATIKDLKSEKSVDDLTKNLTEHSLKFEWISGKMDFEFEEKGKSQSFKSTFRIRKDSVIWMSIYAALGIEVARVVITPDSVRLIDKLHKQYFLGDFTYLSELLKTELNFEMLQSILVGNEYWITERENLYSSIDINKNAYLLSTIRKRKLRKIEKKDKAKADIAQGIWVKPEVYKVLAILINDMSNNRRLKIEYSNFKVIEQQQVATKINAVIQSVEDSYSLEINLSRLKINKPYNLSFSIPEKYVKIH